MLELPHVAGELIAREEIQMRTIRLFAIAAAMVATGVGVWAASTTNARVAPRFLRSGLPHLHPAAEGPTSPWGWPELFWIEASTAGPTLRTMDSILSATTGRFWKLLPAAARALKAAMQRSYPGDTRI
jgi:hypothetical protein